MLGRINAIVSKANKIKIIEIAATEQPEFLKQNSAASGAKIIGITIIINAITPKIAKTFFKSIVKRTPGVEPGQIRAAAEPSNRCGTCAQNSVSIASFKHLSAESS